MEHTEAQQSQAVERYFLNEMTGGERDSFEDHYFDCRLCAEEMADGAKLVAAGRRVALNAPNVVPMPRRWTAWVSSAAAAVIAFIVGVGLPVSSSPSLVVASEIPMEMGVSRGPGEAATVIDSKNPILLVTITDPRPFPSYEILIRDSGRKVVASTPVTADQAKDTIPLLPRSLPAGSYVMSIDGVRDGNHTKIDEREFTVR
jgi:hypothetical protein